MSYHCLKAMIRLKACLTLRNSQARASMAVAMRGLAMLALASIAPLSAALGTTRISRALGCARLRIVVGLPLAAVLLVQRSALLGLPVFTSFLGFSQPQTKRLKARFAVLYSALCRDCSGRDAVTVRNQQVRFCQVCVCVCACVWGAMLVDLSCAFGCDAEYH